MGLDCLIGRHEAGTRRVRNQGLVFGCCRECGRDLVRSRGSWRAVPKGFKVVWRRPGAADPADAAQLLLDLPAMGRTLAAAPAPARRPGRAAAAAELLLIAIRGLALLAAFRIRAWARAAVTPRTAPQPVLCLPIP